MRVASYVANHYDFAPDIQIDDDGLVGNSCFRRITVSVAAPKQSLHLFLSPDRRFISETLLDLNISPNAERERVARETQTSMLADASPAEGQTSAPITIVEFSDFQCPFCKRFSDYWASLAREDRQGVRLVFKHLPLPIHAWARPAAILSVCASFQGNKAFWDIAAFFFDNQSMITSENLAYKISEFARSTGSIDYERLRKCADEPHAKELIVRDESMAQLYHIDATPTVFINGVRKVGFASNSELEQALRGAKLRTTRKGIVNLLR